MVNILESLSGLFTNHIEAGKFSVLN